MLVRFLARLLLALTFAILALPVPALAQESNWRELRTERFAILYTEGDTRTAQQYATSS